MRVNCLANHFRLTDTSRHCPLSHQFIVPFIDRDPENRRRHLIFNICGVFALLFIVVMTIVGYVTK